MKIADITATPVSHMIEGQHVRFGVGAVRKHDFVLVKVMTDDGVVGWGESHHAQAPTAVANLISTTLRELLIGHDPMNSEDLLALVWRTQLQSHGLGTGVAIAYSGIDMALWDIRGKVADLPVSRLLGASPKQFPAYAGGLALGFKEPARLVDEVLNYVSEAGFRGVKLRLGDDVGADSARVRAVRDAVGPNLDLMVDINTAYDLVNVSALLPALEEIHAAWIEEPMRLDVTHLLRLLRDRTHLPIAVGENHLGLSAFRTLLELHCVDIVQADASKTGGITELKKIGDLTASNGLRFAPHCSHTPLNYSATLQVMSAVSTSWYFEAPVQSNPVVDAIFWPAIRTVDGMVTTPERPGLGIDIDEAALASFSATPGAAYVK